MVSMSEAKSTSTITVNAKRLPEWFEAEMERIGFKRMDITRKERAQRRALKQRPIKVQGYGNV